MKKILILLVLLFSTSVSSLAWNENYEDCILENMKGIGSDLAAIAIKDACKAKHINTIFSHTNTNFLFVLKQKHKS